MTDRKNDKIYGNLSPSYDIESVYMPWKGISLQLF